MKKTVVICEINPYHNGHRYIFEQARTNENDLILAVMSGNFTQRGTPAVYDKYERARLLVSSPDSATPAAADLVTELPFPWCSSGVEAFARGGVAIALALGADSVVCGSENGNADFIYRAAALKSSAEYLRRIQAYEKNDRRGEGSAFLHDSVMRELGFSLGANDKLAVEYARNLNCIAPEVPLQVFPRITTQSALPYRSASSLRQDLFTKGPTAVAPYVPKEAFAAYSSLQAVNLTRFRELCWIYCRLFWNIAATPEDSYAENAGGVARHIRAAAEQSCNADDFFERVRTKKYTNARIQRAILFSMLQIPQNLLTETPQYTVLLAANEKGRAYLAERRRTAVFPIITKPAAPGNAPETQYRYLAAADSLYAMCNNPPREHRAYLKKRPAICP